MNRLEFVKRLFEFLPYGLPQGEKEAIYTCGLRDLTAYHCSALPSYGRILRALNFVTENINCVEDIPFIPVRLFKEYDLVSVERSDVVKTMTSSGTTGQAVSKIMLDKSTAANQTKVLTRIVSDFIGTKRMPMLIIDSKSTISNRHTFSARGAGILGFSMFGFDTVYAFDDVMNVDIDAINMFLDKHKSEMILLFGFTSIIWQHLYLPCKNSGIRLPLDNAVLIHGGGWKKLADQAIDNELFKSKLQDQFGIKKIFNYYGMVEQTGSIFMECQHGNLHASVFSDLIIRNVKDFKPLPENKSGLIQLVSLLPTSYPGQSILTEDVGEITGIDQCECGRLGKTFKIHGRIKNAEARGCSDTYSAENKHKINDPKIDNTANANTEITVQDKSNNYCNDNCAVEYLAGKRGDIVTAIDVPYSDVCIDFLDDLSKQIRSNKTAATFADVISFAFWCRRSNITKLKSAYSDGANRLGRGAVFHIAPSNVPINFAFSFAFGLLAGNSNIVRVPSRLFPQTEIICNAIDAVLNDDKYKSICVSNSFVRYDRNDNLTAKFSAQSQARIIWGGNQTIQNIRKFQISPNGVEITFADRYSFCVIDSDAVNRLDDAGLDKLADGFYNDTYLIDQNACSSPHLIIWTNNYCNDNSKPPDELAKQKFWQAVYAKTNKGKTGAITGRNYILSDIHAVDKYTQLCQIAVESCDISAVICYDNLLYRVLLKNLPATADKLRGRFGLFFEYDLRQLDELSKCVNSTYQTLTYFGLDAEMLGDWVISRRLSGIDRIVPIGSALDISVIWDGYDIVKQLSRIISVKF
ncbi:MAG: hypothetical protein LBT09_11635 [Planctomycetaceae bacterium]|jgi:phenylacetate-coenzyme A ligase PaaK-like adenylate-forming protein|nr:hypothetical protein [Planctomycetaceae bacterium]